MRPDYCPIDNQPCQSLCNEPCSKRPKLKPLTDEQIYSVLENLQVMYNRPPTTDSRIIFARAIEAKLKEKNI